MGQHPVDVKLSVGVGRRSIRHIANGDGCYNRLHRMYVAWPKQK